MKLRAAPGIFRLGLLYGAPYAPHQAPDNTLRMDQLADAVVSSGSGLTRLADRLDKAGLVAGSPCPEVRRGRQAVLTAEGKAEAG